VRLKIIAGVLMLILAISLGFNVYYYLQVINRQNIINNIRSEIILEWANEMDVAAHYLKNVTTNIDVAEQYGVRWFFLSAYHIMKTTYEQGDDREFYEPLAYAPLDVAGNLIAYEEGAQVAPVVERRISSGAIEMFGNLSDRIWSVTDLIFKEAQTLASQNGVDPMRLLEEKGILDDVIEGCLDISYYSLQIAEFNPKFQ
jgi:predicted RNase H-related nuclease YkuK (DUF458 family)